MGITVTLLIVCLIFIIIITGLEYAYMASNKLAIELKKNQDGNSGKLLRGFFEEPERFWSATIISFYVLLVSFCFLLTGLTDKLANTLPVSFRESFDTYPYFRALIDLVLAVSLILGGIGVIAKRSFEYYPEQKLNTWARFVNLLCDITAPFASIFTGISEFILKYLFNVRISKKESIFERINTRKFLRQSIHGHDNMDEAHRELFERALQLTKVKVRKCLTPRNETISIDILAPIKELRDTFVETKLSKIVIFDETLDNVLGYAHHLDLNRRPTTIAEILHPIPTVPETMSAIDLMHKFTKDRKSIAWVIDEFGGTAGFVTMEDVLEEVFGDIKDEYDTEEFTEKQISETEYIFSGRLEVDYLNEQYGFELDASEADTLSGYIIASHESIPKLQDRIIVDNFEIEIIKVTDTRIETVKMRLLHI